MERRPYRAVSVKRVDVERLGEAVRDRGIVVGVDVAKEKMYAAVMEEGYKAKARIKWEHPGETEEFVSLVSGLPAGNVQVAMEPSGSYGDSLRYQLIRRGVMVFRVSPKRSHDAQEVFDGVASMHDGKACMIVGKLHMEGLSEPWPFRGEEDRRLGAALSLMELYDDAYRRNVNRVEGQLARCWPELSGYLGLGSATMLELLGRYGGPGEVWRHRGEAGDLMRRVGGTFLKEEKIAGVIESAGRTLGVPQIEEEREALAELARETRRAQRRAESAKRRVERLSEGHEVCRHMGKVIGKATGAVMCYFGGDPLCYESVGSYVKSLGLNLKVKESGKHAGQLRITKRGPSVVRRYLYWAALRVIQQDRVFQAWYERKVERDGGKKGRAIVAVMRKLVKGLWHVARGEPLKSGLLFNTGRLGLGMV